MSNIDKIRQEIENSIKAFEFNGGIYDSFEAGELSAYKEILDFIDSLQQEHPEVDLEKFTQKMNDWKARYNHPDNIPIKATMAFTARMFYQYPNVARQWYDSLPKATMD